MYRCNTCQKVVPSLKAARKHALQGHRTQRDAFAAGKLHTLELVKAEAR